jgi:hypothetical protein
MIADIITRLTAEVPELAGRIDGVAELAVLQKKDALPQTTPAAFVVPLGLDAAPAADATGVHAQDMRLRTGILLVMTVTDDAGGGRALEAVTPLVEAVRLALAGWLPPEASAPMALLRERLAEMRAGTVFWQSEFEHREQLRIT